MLSGNHTRGHVHGFVGIVSHGNQLGIYLRNHATLFDRPVQPVE